MEKIVGSDSEKTGQSKSRSGVEGRGGVLDGPYQTHLGVRSNSPGFSTVGPPISVPSFTENDCTGP